MAASGERRPRRGPAPIASFDHDVSDEVRPPSSPETKQTFQLPEIREDSSAAGPSSAPPPAGPGPRERSQSTPGLTTPAAPRIDISRASSSSHHDSRDSSPDLALFAGTADERAAAHLGFREDGALDLRSSTEELAFLEPAPPAPPPPASRRHSRKDSQGSEAALLAISGRTSRLSSVGSQCSAHSALSALSHVSHTSRVSRLSVVSGVSRSPSPHKMLLETSFCGPKPIETDPEICAAAVEERLLEIAKQQAPQLAVVAPPAAAPDARDRREVRTEATVEVAPPARAAPAPEPPGVAITPAEAVTPAVAVTPAADDKRDKETRNRARADERRARSRERRDRSQPERPEVYKSRNKSKDVIRIKLKPDEDYEDDDDDDEEESERAGAGGSARKPASLALGGTARPRSPSPAPAAPSRKSSFCSLFKSRETIASPDSPSDALRRKKSLNEGRSRSKSRDRSAPPPAAGKLRGSVLSLFKTPRRSAASPSPSSRAASPGPPPSVPPPAPLRGLKYYEDSRDGIIHIPLRTPPDEAAGEPEPREAVRPASAPCARASPGPAAGGPDRTSAPAVAPPAKPVQRTVLPDGSIIIPLHSPTDRSPPAQITETRPQQARVEAVVEPPPARGSPSPPEPQPAPPSSPPTPPTPRPAPEPEPEPPRSRRKERLVFMTHVGSTEQVFSTQFSITKTPSVTSEISESFPSLAEEPRAPVLRDTHIAANTPDAATPGGESPAGARDSSESEGSSEPGAGAGASEAEQRGLVVQESFEEELPYVPTTLPLERSLALPMLPVRERAVIHISSVERPRSAAPRPAPPAAVLPPPPAAAPPPPPASERLRIRLPRRASAAPAPAAAAAAPAPAVAVAAARSRTRSGSGSDGGEVRKPDWIDFSEVPERRKAARRIQTLPRAAAGEAAGADPAPHVGYVEPDQCRCECHRAGDANHDAMSPRSQTSPESNSSARVQVSVAVARPFTADLDVRDVPDHVPHVPHASHVPRVPHVPDEARS
ncbi:nascent polypeptide-associated complex subunit alpha, muscle-specific form-like [Pectinophora gossypiella]|uniref:nascent polypeptide-associated complex subunit alpha, muscle-specific form-like n=1 Tax=Pectinophora gossypiella TaxID=13191 RepID=UPI00214EE922|nr:nascent polypeptide-associated complex subunit alpha, muscle-specific form-like [Pectinophora gossypiella]